MTGSLVDLPEPYVVSFAQQGFPKGKLGEQLATVYEIKVNGLEYLFEPFRDSSRTRFQDSPNEEEKRRDIKH